MGRREAAKGREKGGPTKEPDMPSIIRQLQVDITQQLSKAVFYAALLVSEALSQTGGMAPLPLLWAHLTLHPLS